MCSELCAVNGTVSREREREGKRDVVWTPWQGGLVIFCLHVIVFCVWLNLLSGLRCLDWDFVLGWVCWA